LLNKPIFVKTSFSSLPFHKFMGQNKVILTPPIDFLLRFYPKIRSCAKLRSLVKYLKHQFPTDSGCSDHFHRRIISPFQGLGRVGVRVPMGFTHRYDIAPLRGFRGDAQASERGVALASS